jgi:uncharacterized protein DUF4845
VTTPKWRLAAGGVVLCLLGFFGLRLTPLYYHNYQLQQFVEDATQRVQNQTKSDDLLRTWVVEKAASLDLPVRADDVHIIRSGDGMRIEVRYAVRVDLPGYTVNLHFYPGAGR